MHVVFNSLFSRFFRCLEQRSHIDIEAHIGITGGNHFGSPVVTVLAHFSDHDTWTTSGQFGKLIGHCLCFLEVGIFAGNTWIYSTHGSDNSFITSDNFFTCIGDFSQRSAFLSSIYSQFQQITFAGFDTFGDGIQSSVYFSLITFGFQFFQTGDLSFTNCSIINFKNIDRILFV